MTDSARKSLQKCVDCSLQPGIDDLDDCCSTCGALHREDTVTMLSHPDKILVHLTRIGLQDLAESMHTNRSLVSSALQFRIGRILYDTVAVIRTQYEHYWVDVRKEGAWYRCDDASVKVISQREVTKPCASVVAWFGVKET